MIIFRYLTREVMNMMMAIVIMLLLIFITNIFSGYMDALSDGELTLLSLLKIISMQVPLLLGYLLPLALFLSILIVYARLCMQNEMVVLQSCGFSRLKLYAYTFGYSGVVILLVLLLMLYVEPVMQKYRLQLKADAVAEATLAKITPRRFTPLGKLNGYLYAQKKENFSQKLHHVLWARKLSDATTMRNGKELAPRWDVVSAAWADETQLPGIMDHFMVFHNGTEYVGYPGRMDFDVSHFKNYSVRLSSEIAKLNNPIKFAPTSVLFKQQATHVDARAELQWRFAIPISGFLLVFIALCFGQMNPRRGGRFVQIFPAVLLYILYADLMFVARNQIASNTKLGYVAGMWWVHGLFALIAIIFVSYDFKWWQLFKSHLLKSSSRHTKGG